ncbi:MAG TPA: hypothetical protein VGC76_07695 [Pyrinomonadaceae bacterium]|jgi:hypothetical protein
MRKNLIVLFAVFILGLTTAINIDAQIRPYTATDAQVQSLLSRIETRTDSFRRSVNTALDSSSLNGTDSEDTIVNYISEFETATDTLKGNFDSRRSVDSDVEDVLNRASYINQFMQNNRLTASAQSNWNYLRTDLNTLARYYAVSWNWTNPVTPTTSTSTRSYRVTDATVQGILARIATGTDVFKTSVNRALYRQNNTDMSNEVARYISDFENETDRLKQRFDSRQSVNTDVSQVLNKATLIDSFMRSNRLNTAAQRDWNLLKTDLNTLAGYYDVSWNWTNPTPVYNNDNNNTGLGGLPYKVSDTNVRTLLTRLGTNTDNYRRQISLDLDRSALNNTRSEDAAVGYITDFQNSVDKLRQNFDSRRSASSDVEEVLNRAYNIESFMRDYRFSTTTQTQWAAIRSDLDTLTNYYNVSWNWNRQNTQTSRFDQMLSGTYRLNLTQSDNVAEVVDRATTTGYQTTQRDRVKNNLERRLTSPDMLAIEKVGSQVTIASSTAPQVTFSADGTPRTETNNNGRSVKITASTTYDGVSLNYEGERMNDFYVNFMPMSNGQLKVVRRVYLENRNETVTVASVYDKVGSTAQWSQVNNNNDQTTTTGALNNTFVIPNNTKLTAALTTPISTKTSQNGDRFQMEVTSPSQFDGAIIEGRVAKAERSGRVSGRANVSLEFDTIRLRNGQTYRFAGFVDAVKLSSGENVTVNNEGTVRDNNQTTKTAQRAGIGAALGALIGAIAGGGQGAVIGAGVGAGAGAGTVILQGRDDVELDNGTEFSITASAPTSVSLNR